MDAMSDINSGFSSLRSRTGSSATLPRLTAMSLSQFEGPKPIDSHWDQDAPIHEDAEIIPGEYPDDSIRADDSEEHTSWLLQHASPSVVKEKLVELSTHGLAGEFLVFKSETEPRCFGLTVKGASGSFHNFVIRPSGASGYCLRERSLNATFNSIKDLIEDLVNGKSFDTRHLASKSGPLKVKMRYPAVTATPGARPHGEVVQNPLFNNEDKAEGESDNEEEGYLDMDSADDGDDGGDDNGDNSKAGNPTLRRPPRTRDPALGDALNRETDTKNKLIKAQAMYDALYGSTISPADPDATALAGLTSERILSLQREIAIISAGLNEKMEEKALLYGQRKRLEERFLMKQHELQSLVQSRGHLQTAFAERKNRASQLATLDQEIKANLATKNSALEALVKKLREAEQALIIKSSGLVKLNGEGHMRKAALQADESQISVLRKQLQVVTGSLEVKYREFNRVQSQLHAIQRLLQGEEEEVYSQPNIQNRPATVNRARMTNLRNQAKAAEGDVLSHQKLLASLRKDEAELRHQLSELGHDDPSPIKPQRINRRSSQLADMQANIDLVREEALLAVLQL